MTDQGSVDRRHYQPTAVENEGLQRALQMGPTLQMEKSDITGIFTLKRQAKGTLHSHKNNIDLKARDKHDDRLNINKGVSLKHIALQKQLYVTFGLNNKQVLETFVR